MDAGTAFAAGLTAVIGLGSVAVALLSLRPENRLRGASRTDPEDAAAVGSNAAALGATGVGLLALALAIAVDVPERVVGASSVLAAAGLCVVLGWLIRYRDRRELLTNPAVDRETAERTGAAVVLCGLLLVPLAPAIWVGASAVLVGSLGICGAVVSFSAVAYAYR